MTKTEDRELRQANQKYQRLTAYGCKQRGAVYDEAACKRAWQEWEDVRTRIFPPPS